MKQTHLTIVQGTPFEVLVRLTRKDEDGESVPFPIPDGFVKLQARETVQSSDTLLDISSNDEEIVVDGDAGTFEIKLTSAQTSALDWGSCVKPKKAVFQCEVTPAGDEPFRALEGTLTLDREVVR